MKQFPNTATKIKVSFNCDLCGVETTLLAEVPASGQTTLSVACPVCFKEFDVTICKGNNGQDSTVSVADIDDSEITITLE